MEKESKTKQIAIRFDIGSYEKINKFATKEHRGLGDFVRHATLSYIEKLMQSENAADKE
ncbi:MAG: hypothetical protein FWC78_03020 [Defluviitaleaceae bacterium]|nr:hypothetical protein [Defluviitaleaceae bacterium]